MRASILFLVAITAACVHAEERFDSSSPPPGEPGGGGAEPFRCLYDSDCAPAAATCCDCPTFAVNRADPVVRGCSGVMCPPLECRENALAICSAEGTCKLACNAIACPGQACFDGFARDANGCLTCECAMPDPNGCKLDDECVRTRADCCGCKLGGRDTAVRDVDQAAYDDGLGCSPSPACPGIDVCTADQPQCVQGRCELLPTDLVTGACGRFDLPPCPPGQECTVNLSDPANMQGLGVCATP